MARSNKYTMTIKTEDTSLTLYNKLRVDVANPESYPLKVPLTLGGLPFLPLIRTDIQH